MSLYHDKAHEFVQQYEAVTAQDVHGQWLKLLSDLAPGNALDIGAGSGRDARYLAEVGFTVTAVEPADALREQAINLCNQLPEHQNIKWLADELPNLPRLKDQQGRFEIVLLSAVWMHLTLTERYQALPVLNRLLASDGLLVITLRHGTFTDGRLSYTVSSDEILQLVLQHQLPLSPLQITHLETDALGRNDVLWQTVVLKKG
ncbi:class I SAM-dependent methyltransferase [Rheinheimera sp. 4Y26]|uniref:class I SAM-dependent methyltransferase n=1 Tax=Rheinheimera sp. 4Y26 TaxID=2977811 RepID=UPI0021B12F59|nr:class I SAM-dependent methyltransferase [Rheinheimera sp. 4Y26]MCT6699892.1 class I SAM-dependent methyltransferase [Rheinheimera sp. 4Y26]